jgi:predicted ferric reductase
MSQEGLSNLDTRYPPTPKEVRYFMAAYPLIVLGGAGWFSGSEWFWWVAAFCAIGWLSAVWQFLANTHRREGYSAAVEEFTRHRFQEDVLAGKIPLAKRSEL